MILPALGAGGCERVVSLIANSWAARGWKVAIITFESSETRPYYDIDSRIHLVRLDLPNERPGQLRGAWRSLLRVRRLRRQLLQLAPDIVISFLTKINVQTLAASIGLGQTVMICERNNPERQPMSPFWRILQNQLGRRAVLILQTNASRKAFPSGMQKRAYVIPNPVELRQTVVDANSRSVVAVGRLVRQKGFDMLLLAFARIAERFPSWNLVIWGEGPERGALEAMRSDLGLVGRVFLPGITKEPGTWVESGSIFVLSSRYEGFPNVLIEAMGAGLAVLSFDCPWGPSEIISSGKDGVLVPAEDEGALADGLADLISRPDVRRTLAANALKAVERFKHDDVIALWDQAIRQSVPSISSAGGR